MNEVDAQEILTKYANGTPFASHIIEDAHKTLLAKTPINYCCLKCQKDFYTYTHSPEHIKQLCYSCYIENCSK